ncbi:MAG: dephospho-CoA kinase [Actinobacteria bacterium]|nr:MAG: dephospho-CoA kinase [Actinomycetota bacterium]
MGLTGGMGAGKSTALAVLERLGAAVLSTDAIVHELYEDEELREALRERFGAQAVPGGRVDRAAVAARAFASEEDRAWLEALLWPLVGGRVLAWLQRVRAGSERACNGARPRAAVVEVPLLFEAGMEEVFDATIAVVAREELRRERAARRGHALEDERAARQLAQDAKAQRATFVVHNDGSELALERELSEILAKLAR